MHGLAYGQGVEARRAVACICPPSPSRTNSSAQRAAVAAQSLPIAVVFRRACELERDVVGDAAAVDAEFRSRRRASGPPFGLPRRRSEPL
jgi:hypothetical protein